MSLMTPCGFSLLLHENPGRLPGFKHESTICHAGFAGRSVGIVVGQPGNKPYHDAPDSDPLARPGPLPGVSVSGHPFFAVWPHCPPAWSAAEVLGFPRSKLISRA